MAKFAVGAENGTPIELYFEDLGEGTPVVLIHGWPLSGRSWENQIGPLIAAGYRVITYDRRGFGWSSQPWNGYEYDTFAADLNSLIEHLDLEQAVLVGFSMGGGEVARYLSTYGSGRISKAVLAGAVTPYMFKSDDNPDGGLDDATIAQFEGGVTGERLGFLDDFTKMFFQGGPGAPVISEPNRLYNRDIAAFASAKGTLDCIAAFGRTDFRADVAKIDVPTLVIHGDSDHIVPFEVSGKRSHEAIADSELVVIEGAPHGLLVTHASEFNAALLEFLAK